MSPDGLAWTAIAPGTHSFATPEVFIRNTISQTGSSGAIGAGSLVSITFPPGSGQAQVALTRSSELQTWSSIPPGDLALTPPMFFRVEVMPVLARPGALSAAAFSFFSIRLDWVDNSDYESGFRVERRDAGGEFSLLTTLASDLTSYTDVGLEEETAYEYRILAFNATEASDFSEVAGATTGSRAASVWDETFDDLPDGTREDTGNTAWTSTAVLADGGSYGVLSGAFDIAKAMPGRWESELIPIVGTATVTVVHEGDPDMESNDYISIYTIVDGGEPVPLVSNLTGYYSVRTDSTDVSGSSVQVRIDTYSTGSTEHHRIDRVTVLGATGLSLSAAASDLVAVSESPSSIDLSWTDNSVNETGFIISRRESGGEFSMRTTVGQNVTTFTDTGLQPSTDYDYRVVAINEQGESTPSNTVSARTWSTLPPIAPTGLGASVDRLNVTLNWNDNSLDETGYRVYRQAPGESGFSLIANLDADAARYTDANLQPVSEYLYQISAYNSMGESALVGPVSATTEAVTIPSAEAVPLWPLINASFELSTSEGGWLEDDADGRITMTASSNPAPPSGSRLLRINGPGGKIEQAIYQPLAGHRYEVKAWIYNHGTVGIRDLGSDELYEVSSNHGSTWKEVSFTCVSTGSPALIYAKYGPGSGNALFDAFAADDISSEADLALPPPTKIMRYPSQVIDLSWWKITLPINNAQELYTPELYTTSLDPWFQLVQDEDGYAVQFRANHGGSTTSGSSNPRSELREMFQNYHYRNSSSSADWSNTDGKTHTMWIKQKVTHLTYVKPQVVVGQIHDSGDDVTVFRMEGLLGGPTGNGGTVGVLDTHAKLWITNGNSSHGYLVDPNYELGTVFTVKFIAHDGIIEFEYNGVRLPYVHTQNVSGCFFKIGNYTQSHKGTAPNEVDEAYAETYVYDYYINHE